MPRLDTAGSTLFKLTWKQKRTPLGRWYLERAASALRTSGSDSTSLWATPAERDYRTANLKTFKERGGGKKGEQLPNQVKLLASWPTPNTEDCKRDDWTEKALADAVDMGMVPLSTSQRLRSFASLAAWPTPMAGSPATESYNEAGNTDSSRKTVALAAWPTPNCPSGGRVQSDAVTISQRKPDGTKAQAALENVVKLAGPVRLTAGGEVLTGSDAGMESSGQLDPAHSRWLQGVPPAWDDFACTATQSVSQRRKRLSKRTSRQREVDET